MTQARTFVVSLVLAAVFCSALIPGTPNLLWALFVPLFWFAVSLVVLAVCRRAAGSGFPRLPFLPVLASRAPPIA